MVKAPARSSASELDIICLFYTSINTLPVDSTYTPVLKVNYNVESTRVGQAIDYDKLTIDCLLYTSRCV